MKYQIYYNTLKKDIDYINLVKTINISYSSVSTDLQIYKIINNKDQFLYYRQYIVNSLCDTSSFDSSEILTILALDTKIIQEGIQKNTISINNNIYDDGKNNLINKEGQVLGYVNYNYGLFILFDQYININLICDILQRYIEHKYVISIDSNILNDTTNISNYQFINNEYIKKNKQINPYITSIGLYNQNNELLAIAKIVNPIRKLSDSDMKFEINLCLV